MYLIKEVNDFIEKQKMNINSPYYKNDEFLKSIMLLTNDKVLLHLVIFSIILKIKDNEPNFIYTHFYNNNTDNITRIEEYMVNTNIANQNFVTSKKLAFDLYLKKLSDFIYLTYEKTLSDFLLNNNAFPVKSL